MEMGRKGRGGDLGCGRVEGLHPLRKQQGRLSVGWKGGNAR